MKRYAILFSVIFLRVAFRATCGYAIELIPAQRSSAAPMHVLSRRHAATSSDSVRLVQASLSRRRHDADGALQPFLHGAAHWLPYISQVWISAVKPFLIPQRVVPLIHPPA